MTQGSRAAAGDPAGDGDAEVEALLRRSRPVPPAAMRARLRARFFELEEGAGGFGRIANPLRVAVATGGTGSLLLGVVSLGLLGVGPFAA